MKNTLTSTEQIDRDYLYMRNWEKIKFLRKCIHFGIYHPELSSLKMVGGRLHYEKSR